MATFVSMLRRRIIKNLGDFTSFQLFLHPMNVKTDNAITTYKMVDELWLYTNNTSMLKRSMPK